MSQDTQPIEFTVEELLRLHRDWIKMLIIEQRKTEVEIVEILYERNISVSLYQLRLFLQQWRLISSASPAKVSTSVRQVLESRRPEAATSAEVESHNSHVQQSLPSLPEFSSASSFHCATESNETPYRMHPTLRELSGHRRHRRRTDDPSLSPPYAHEGSSPLEYYVRDAQTHEMLAIGLVKTRRRERAYL
ncbi:hypothetical protein OIDMADRAFT_182175 [Oidiodendron maius Zn]|uniref:Clr5 domain-containing protein n=1 Tax=Oidiodendron maius (strain Zn) TaxID=913774 RepID=A0A0C3GP00_OIDMZ|nr:hypothetical protein OIDMADRAFT_182175 [Oidiodendron maius Zn]